MSPLAVEVEAAAGDWSALGDPHALAQHAVEAAVAELAETAGEEAAGFLDGYEISIRLTDDREMRALNAEHRGRDAPTNVLSWPALPLEPGPEGRPPAPPAAPNPGAPLGDLALGAETVAREAAERNLALSDHVAHLIIHGVLHCLGYDHVRDGDADVMEAVERRALARIRIADPYI